MRARGGSTVCSTRSTRGRTPDTDGDGVGDLRGIIEHLDHLAWLGVDGLWLNPTTVSPDADWGYDVADYQDVQPVLGTLADLDELVAEARKRHIRVLLDLVPNHTSIRHPWFEASRSSRDDPKRDWYVAGPEVRRLATEQLAQQLRRSGVDARRDDRPVLPAQLPRRAARPQLVERGRPRRVRPHPALLVRPWDRRLPRRRRAHGRQGRAAARQPADHRRRPLVRALPGPAPGVQREPAGGARRDPALARHRRGVRPAAHLRGRDARVRRADSRGVLRARRRAEPRVQLLVAPRRPRCARAAAGRREHPRRDPARGLARVDGRQPRRVPVPVALGRGRPAEGARPR